MSLEISYQPLGGSRLVADYLAGGAPATGFFAAPPFSLPAYRERLPRLALRFDRERREAAATALRPTSDAARRRLERFVEVGGAVVTTGQQAGLFGGPLFTVYKALTAVRLAQELEARLGIVVLPVFWVASEDHDWAEVNHTYMLDRDGRLCRLGLGSVDPAPLPMSDRTLGEGIGGVIEQVRQVVHEEPFGEEVLQRVRECYAPERSVAGAFAELVGSQLAPFDVLVADAADPALKRASMPVLRRELHGLGHHERLLGESAEAIGAAGYSVQVPVLGGGSNLFLRTSYGRERLFLDPRGWIARESGARFASAELDARLREEPALFSPNVLLRPVVESYVFPVLAYVAGPGEMAYWAQLQPLFAAHDVDMPAVYPRASATLVEDPARELLQATGLPAGALRRPRHELVAEHARATVPPAVEQRLRLLREGLVREFDALAREAADVDETLRGAVAARRNRALLEVRDAERTVLRAVARGARPWTEAMDAAANHFFPLGQPQERVLNILPLLARYGPSLLRSFADGIAIPLRNE